MARRSLFLPQMTHKMAWRDQEKDGNIRVNFELFLRYKNSTIEIEILMRMTAKDGYLIFLASKRQSKNLKFSAA